MDEFDRAVAQGAAAAIKEACKEFLGAAITFGKKQVDKLAVEFETAFTKYLADASRLHGKTKTLLSPTTPLDIESTYVSIELCDCWDRTGATITETTFIDRLRWMGRVAITGVGGSGKSVFLKHLFLRFVKGDLDRIPMFIELRNIPPASTIKYYLFSQVHQVSPKVDLDLFEYALKRGKFILLLDGMDEIDPERRDAIARDLFELTYSFSDNIFVVSSRPDIQIRSWQAFHELSIAKLTIKQVNRLIQKVTWNEEIKRDFLKAIDGGLYESHEEFLSNPLLCTLMLLTFTDMANIPSKMHLFFARAFDVLLFRHDNMKPTHYKRPFKTKLAMDDFERVLRSFSAFAYLEHGSSIKTGSAIQCVKKASQLEGRDVSPDDFLDDLCRCVSILLNEGDQYSYIHRAFQEYFVARFFAERRFDGWDLLLEIIAKQRPHDIVLGLLFEINKVRFEREFFAPRIHRLANQLAELDLSMNPADAFRLFFVGFSCRKNMLSLIAVRESDRTQPPWHYLLGPLREKYDIYMDFGAQDFNWQQHLTGGRFEELTLKRSTDIECSGVSNELLESTPIQIGLQQFKRAIKQLDEELERSVESQERLLSDLISARRRLKRS